MIDVPTSASVHSQWDQAVKDAAYEAYSRRCDGDMVCTLDAVAAWDGPKIPEKTLYDWRTRYAWRRKLDAEKQAIAPLSWDLYFGGLSVAAPEAVRYLRSVISNDSESTRDRIAAARAILSQVAAHVEQLEQRASVGAAPPVSLDGLTDAELLALGEELHRG